MIHLRAKTDYYYFNHIWKRPTGLNIPMLYRARSRYQPGIARQRQRKICLPCYVLDCSLFDHSGKYSVGSPRIWKRRNADELHLYKPDTEFEELQTPEVERCNCFIMFTGGELAGLDTLFPPGERLLILQDREHCMTNLIDKIARLGATEGNASFWNAQSLF